MQVRVSNAKEKRSEYIKIRAIKPHILLTCIQHKTFLHLTIIFIHITWLQDMECIAIFYNCANKLLTLVLPWLPSDLKYQYLLFSSPSSYFFSSLLHIGLFHVSNDVLSYAICNHIFPACFLMKSNHLLCGFPKVRFVCLALQCGHLFIHFVGFVGLRVTRISILALQLTPLCPLLILSLRLSDTDTDLSPFRRSLHCL